MNHSDGGTFGRLNAMGPAWPFTTRLSTALAVGLTAYVFALSVRDELYPAHTDFTWLFSNGAPHGWLAIAANVAFYGFSCWAAFCVIHRTKGRERLFFVGWFGFLLSPLKTLRPEWAESVRGLEFFGMTLSLVTALSFLLYPSDVVRSSSTLGPGQR
jgi:hypothetical protein